jgi:hypothetical protein
MRGKRDSIRSHIKELDEILTLIDYIDHPLDIKKLHKGFSLGKGKKNGPYIINKAGFKLWALNDKIHREQGPAMIYSNGDKGYYLFGQYCTKEMHKKLTQSSNTYLLLLMGQGYDEYIEQRLKGQT